MRVGFKPTSSISIRDPGRAAAATSQKAADEKSPGTWQTLRLKPLSAGHRDASSVDVDASAEGGERSFGVVAGRSRLEHARRPVRVQTGQQHRALDLRARASRARVQWRAAAFPGWSAARGRRSRQCGRPCARAASMTRRIGRRDSDASPTSVAENGCPASTPASRRIVVPELPASSGADGEQSCPKPRPSRVTVPSVLGVHLDAERAQAGQRRPAVGARSEMGERRTSIGESAPARHNGAQSTCRPGRVRRPRKRRAGATVAAGMDMSVESYATLVKWSRVLTSPMRWY